MRVLLTNVRLEDRAGTELYLLDVARWLRDHGHVPVAYAPRLGAVADLIRRESIAVVDDLARIGEPPDVIHGHHHLATMTAIAHFPGVPVVAYCHGWMPWEEIPVKHPAIRRYVAVDDLTRQRIVLESGVAPGLVSVLPNFVDLNRFPMRAVVAERPRRALLFSNYAVPGRPWVEAIAAACAAKGVAFEVVGRGWGNPVDRPEELLSQFDLVFAKGRAAMEALVTGAAVIVCDAPGLGPLVTPDNFAEVSAANFGMPVQRLPHDVSVIEASIDEYERDLVTAVSTIARDQRAMDKVAPQIVTLYEEAISDVARSPVDDAAAARSLAEYLHQLNKLNPEPTEQLRRDHAEQLNAVYRTAAATEERAVVAQQRTAVVEAQIAAHQAIGEAKQAHIDELTAEVLTMRGSSSWRITAPMRRLGAAARRLIGRGST